MLAALLLALAPGSPAPGRLPPVQAPVPAVRWIVDGREVSPAALSGREFVCESVTRDARGRVVEIRARPAR